MIGLFNSTYMNVNLAITMTCMVNSTAIAIAEDIDTGGDWSKDPNLTSAFGTSDTCSSAPGTRTVLDYGSFIYPCINTIVASWFPMDERSTAVALFTTGNQVALFFGNPFAARLCDSRFGWQAVYHSSARPFESTNALD
ncbi:hypothetical protein RB195_018987 [Necator americanus]|uniref:Uncharacterized protein n=1 Tax=Necator americanus TaxID=51031 RepID=A0ABR1CDW2_NECAM